MTIQDIAAFGELIGAIAVVVTLIYLAVQIRESNRETRASTTQQTLDSEMFIASQFVEHAEVWDKVVSGADFKDSVERRRGINLFQLAMLDSENRFHQYNDGYLLPQAWEARTNTLRLLVRLPTYRLWKESAAGLSRPADFMEFLDRLVKESYGE